MLRITISLLVVAACGSKSDKPEGTTESGSAKPEVDTPGSGNADARRPPPVGLAKLEVEVDGKPVPMRRAFIKRVSADQWRLQVGDLEGSCEELLSGVVNSQKGATSFVATIAKRLAPDGTESMAVTDFWTAGHTTKATFGGPAKLTGATDKDAKVEIELPQISSADGAKTLLVSGPFTATGCGDQPETGAGAPKGQHVTAASITVAGKKLELKGAVLHGADVTLSASPKDCSPTMPFSPVVLQQTAGKWELSGTWIGDPQSTTDAKDLKLTTGKGGTTSDGPTAALALSGTATIGGYTVKLEGTIEALDCKK